MRRLPLVLLIPALSACPADDDDGASGPCAEETRADAYTDGMRIEGADGALAMTLVSDPSPPDFGENTWTVVLLDAADGDAPLDGCTGTLGTFMPDHGHSSNAPDLTATGAAGTYTLLPDFIMAGYWELSLEADCGGTTDRIDVGFCIEG